MTQHDKIIISIYDRSNTESTLPCLDSIACDSSCENRHGKI